MVSIQKRPNVSLGEWSWDLLQVSISKGNSSTYCFVVILLTYLYGYLAATECKITQFILFYYTGTKLTSLQLLLNRFLMMMMMHSIRGSGCMKLHVLSCNFSSHTYLIFFSLILLSRLSIDVKMEVLRPCCAVRVWRTIWVIAPRHYYFRVIMSFELW